MADIPDPPTPDELLRRLRADIARGRLRPGQRLPLAQTASLYNTGTSTLREVLPRLVEVGLVSNQPMAGFRVAVGSTEELGDLTETRVLVECFALRRSIDEGSLGWESTLVATHHVLANTPTHDEQRQVTDEWQEAHVAFHQALISGCSNRRLVQLAYSLREEAGIYSLSARALAAEDLDVAGEHRALLDAALGRDAELAELLLATHIRAASQMSAATSSRE